LNGARLRAWAVSVLETAKRGAIETQVLGAPNQYISRPPSRSMATCGRGSGVVDYDVQTAVDTENQPDRRARQCVLGSLAACQLKAAKEAIGTASADRGYFDGEKIKTIVHHDDSRSQRIFWLSREALPATADLRHEHAMRTTRYSRVPYARPESRCRPLDCMKYTYEQEVLSECRFAP